MNDERRRIMALLQTNEPQFELTYDSVCGTYPEANGEWEWRKGLYNGAANVGGRTRIGDFIQLKDKHIYESQYYSPINHLSANKCSLSVTLEEWDAVGGSYSGGVVFLCVTNGNIASLAKLEINALCVGNNANANTTSHLRTVVVPLEIPQHFTLKVELDNGVATYYNDDKIIYVDANLIPVEDVICGEKKTYILQSVQNAIGFGANSNTTISQIKYTEG